MNVERGAGGEAAKGAEQAEEGQGAGGRLIDGSIPSVREYVDECVARRDVLFRIVWRDLSIRFRQAYAGLAWMLAKPIMMTAILSFVFGRVSGFQTTAAWPYSAIVLLGLIPWQYFSLASTESVGAFLANRSLVTHTYFPRALIPFATVLSLLSDFAIPLVLVVGLFAWHGIGLSLKILWAPVWLVFYLGLVLSFTLLMSSLNARLRDVQHAMPFAIQFGLFATPVAYSLASVPQPWRDWMAVNPMVGIIEAFRWMLLPNYPLEAWAVGWAASFVVVFFFLSIHAFLRLDKHLAEVL